MPFPKRYIPAETETELAERWRDEGVYRFDRESAAPVFSIDTPPPTVSGFLHLGHVYSYSHADFIARYQRMCGRNVFYPMGYDDNGLPTERLVERRFGVVAEQIGREAFIERCLEISAEIERDYEALWQRLGLSIDWRHTYSTIDERSRRTSQQSFLDLYDKGLVYRRKAPTIWCPECGTAIAQAETSDLERETEFVTIAFSAPEGTTLQIATTRPELLPACVAVFVHPGDPRFRHLIGQTVRTPLYDQEVPVLEDPAAEPDKGTGAVMCCTFGDTTDVEWWKTHNLPLKVAISPDGHMTDIAGEFAGLSVAEARKAIIARLDEAGVVLKRERITQNVRVHERDDTPVEYIVTQQWFTRVLDATDAFLEEGERIHWHPGHMHARFREWVEGLGWDWCISRQRYYGVTFPVWYCDACDEVQLADPGQLPVDPTVTQPARPCSCGSTAFTPERDVMDTWATSSLSPQIAGQWLDDPELYAKVFPFALRPQAHEIIRTWAFYTVVKSHYEFATAPWANVLISGWGLAPEGAGKISKSRGGGPMAPMEMLDRYSSDAARYWAASSGPGRDAVISEEKIGSGAKLATKLWNVAGFSARFLEGSQPVDDPAARTAADRWILSRLHRVVQQATQAFESYDYAAAKNDVEMFFWRDVADNYLEMAKKRLYDAEHPGHDAARATLRTVLLTTVKLFAPIMPFVTDAIFRQLFAGTDGAESIHRSSWPQVDETLIDASADEAGEMLIAVATAVRRYKSDRSLSLGAELGRLHLAPDNAALVGALASGTEDIASVTRARSVEVLSQIDRSIDTITAEGGLTVAVEPLPQAS